MNRRKFFRTAAAIAAAVAVAPLASVSAARREATAKSRGVLTPYVLRKDMACWNQEYQDAPYEIRVPGPFRDPFPYRFNRLEDAEDFLKHLERRQRRYNSAQPIKVTPTLMRR